VECPLAVWLVPVDFEDDVAAVFELPPDAGCVVVW